MRDKKQNGIFCGCRHDFETPPSWKKRKDASTDSGLGASAQTLVLRRIKKQIQLTNLCTLNDFMILWNVIV